MGVTHSIIVKLYLLNLGGFFFWLIVIGCIVLSDLCTVLQTWFLGYWAAQYEIRDPSEVSIPL